VLHSLLRGATGIVQIIRGNSRACHLDSLEGSFVVLAIDGGASMSDQGQNMVRLLSEDADKQAIFLWDCAGW